MITRLFIVFIIVVYILLMLIGIFTLNGWLIFWLLSPFLLGGVIVIGFKIAELYKPVKEWVLTGNWPDEVKIK